MTTPFRLHPQVAIDIAEVLSHTFEKFGARQYDRYEALIHEALDHLIAFPKEGIAAPSLPGYLGFHIRQPGRRARHRFLYAVEPDGTVFVLRLLYDGMDVPRHLPPR
jgi:plasmid stabilization system protein ParE